jgi:hypothetical protein
MMAGAYLLVISKLGRRWLGSQSTSMVLLYKLRVHMSLYVYRYKKEQGTFTCLAMSVVIPLCSFCTLQLVPEYRNQAMKETYSEDEKHYD